LGLYGKSVIFSGGINTINSVNTNDNEGGKAYGLVVDEEQITFLGGINKITAIATSTSSMQNIISIGILLSGSLNFSGGENSISASSNGGQNSYAYGISDYYIDGGSLNIYFTNNGSPVNISASASGAATSNTAYGISLFNGGGTLNYGSSIASSTVITDSLMASNFANNVYGTFVNLSTTSGGDGYAIYSDPATGYSYNYSW
jgi:hypothetical protein